MNESDMASETEQHLLDVSLKNALAAAEPGPAPIGKCLNCDEKFEEESTKRWCDFDCAKDWENRKNADLRRLGKPTISVANMGEE
ncbi:hypothetical protein ACYPKM_02955 [Pseudomonas aeruginosa]